MNGHNHSQCALNPIPLDAVSNPHGDVKVDCGPKLAAAPSLGYEFCRFCGHSVVVDAVLCVHCGRQIRNMQNLPIEVVSEEPKRVSWHIGEMIGLMLFTMLCPLVGYIYGHIGSKEHGKEKQAKGLMIVAAAFRVC